MGTGTGQVAALTRIVAEPRVDEERRLVTAVRRGDDRAFEALYARYQRRIHSYVLGMVKDHGRAEDLTQEVFMSALRRMRETERPIAFKPWVYEIAKNACIDQFRRSRRAEEISLQAADGFAPSDYGRLVGSDPAPDDAVAAKQELDNLCGAFGGLSDTHHEILVLRELEGLSYREIGERMGLSRPAVESTLFRARRRLTEEYDELASGARCLRIQGLIAMAAAQTRLGARESRRLSRHVAYCQPCRREALAAGLDASILTNVPLRTRAGAKIASLLPFPIFARWRDGWIANAPALPEQVSGGWGTLAAVAAVLAAGVGAAGVGTQIADGGDAAPRRPAQHASPAAARSGSTTKATQASGAPTKAAAKPTTAAARDGKRRASGDRTVASPGTGGGSGGSTPSAGGTGGGHAGGSGGVTGGAGAGVPRAKLPSTSGLPSTPGVPGVSLPAASNDPTGPVKNTAGHVIQPVAPVVNGVTDTIGQATQPVTDAVGGAAGTAEGATGVGLP